MVEEAPRDQQYRFTAARVYQALAYAEGGVALYSRDAGNFAPALAWHQQSHAQVEAAYALNPGRYRRVLAESWGDLSRTYLRTGDARQAEAAGREQLRRDQEMAGIDPQNTEARRDLAGAWWSVSGALLAQRHGQEGFAAGERALEMYEGLLQQDPNNREDLDALVEVHERLAEYLLTTGQRTAAVEHYRRNIEHLESLQASMNGIALAVEYGLIADALAPVDRAQAARNYGKALSLWDTLRNAGPLPPKYAEKPAALRQQLTLVSAPTPQIMR
jgi:tetratricopeptide (TPR) repeat protein